MGSADLDALLARCRFPPASTEVRCGVSGGADSLALLVLAVRAGCTVTAVHVDHGLRPGGDIEADAVRRAAASVGAAFVGERVQVPAGANLEARARRARHEVLGGEALLGHTMDDQAETVLLALLRGAALDGLAGMRPDRRPLLGLRRSDTEAVCAAVGLEPFADPSNDDPAFRRNRVRHEVLPLLEVVAERDVVPVIARQAELLRSVADHLEAEAEVVDPTDARAARDAPDAVLRVALRGWLRSASPDRHPPSAAALERVLAVLRGESIGTELAGGASVRRHDGRLRLERTPPAAAPGLDGAPGPVLDEEPEVAPDVVADAWVPPP